MPRGKPLRLVGQRFGCLVVTRRASAGERPKGERNHSHWVCRCDCGVELITRGALLKAGMIKTCGIAGHTWAAVQRMAGVSWQFPIEYRCWETMINRCRNVSDPHHRAYVERGIAVCERWRGDHGFLNFLFDMGEKPTPKHTIERIDNDRGYEPGNCRWATNDEQQRNKRTSIWVEHEGERVLLVELAGRLGLNYATVKGRLKIGWPLDKALTAPVRSYVGRD